MHTLPDRGFPEESPTKKTRAVHSDAVALAARVDRLALLALERLSVEPDPDTIAAAVADLTELRALTGAVLG